MAVPKKRTSRAKKNQRKDVWKKKCIKRSLGVPYYKGLYEETVLPMESQKKKKKGFQSFDPHPPSG